jgi:hypothetical protein
MVDELEAVFSEAFPVAVGTASFEYVSIHRLDKGALAVTMRLLVLDAAADGFGAIRDIKDQLIPLPFKLGDAAQLPRIDALVNALAIVIGRALEHADATKLMPADLVDVSAWKLKKAKTEAQFVDALSKRSRLGKYLPADHQT